MKYPELHVSSFIRSSRRVALVLLSVPLPVMSFFETLMFGLALVTLTRFLFVPAAGTRLSFMLSISIVLSSNSQESLLQMPLLTCRSSFISRSVDKVWKYRAWKTSFEESNRHDDYDLCHTTAELLERQNARQSSMLKKV